jgi:hypothetical protein
VHLAIDYIHPTLERGRCRVRIYLPDDDHDNPIILCSEVSSNAGLSITQAAEVIAGEVISCHRLTKPVWIEHHPPEVTDDASETFDFVIFSCYEVGEVLVGGEWRNEVGVPTAWKRLDRPTGEILVGAGV